MRVSTKIVPVSGSKGKKVSIQETLHLTSTAANRKRLDKAVAEMKKGKFERRS